LRQTLSRGRKIDRLVQPSLSPVARSGASQPFQAVFLDSSSITGLLPLSSPRTGQGSFPPLALPSFVGTTSPSVIRIRRCWPSRVHRWSESCHFPPRLRTSLVAHRSSPARAAVTTPMGQPAACLARFTGYIGLPRYCGGSAPTSGVSRPARRSLALQPAWPLTS
jgi:hypothetical protein